MTTLSTIEARLQAAGRGDPVALVGPQAAAVGPARLADNLAAIEAEVLAPAPSLAARAVGRLGVPESTVRLVTATPGLRRSWWLAVGIAVLFALAVADDTRTDAEAITVFLTMAPLVPLLGVALAFGPRVDPTHDLVVAAPRDAFRVFLVRATTVLAASIAVLTVGSLLLPEGGWHRIAWLLPALATTASCSALSTRLDARSAAGVVAITWLVVSIVATRAASAGAAFGIAMQVGSVVVAGAAAVVFLARRRGLETLMAGGR
jgi:hypothetical protein